MRKLFSLLFFVSAFAQASNWGVAAVGDNLIVYVDSNSISHSGKYQKAWVKFSFAADQVGALYSNFKKYRSFTNLEYVSCDERLSGELQTTYYEGAMGTGEVVSIINLNLNQVKFSEVAPDTLGESIFNFICKASDKKYKHGAV